MNKKKNNTPTDITIKFANAKAAYHFASWLCGAGEQDYWQWMECREQEDQDDITAIDFDYHGSSNSQFMGDNIIRTTVSRLDKNDK